MKSLPKRTKLLALLAVISASGSVFSPAATAGEWWHEFKHEMHIGYHRNNVWPQPFSEMAAYQTRAPFHVMVQKGWMLHNTIGHELFRDGDGALSAAGRDRVHWIASQAPQNRRVVHVLRGTSEKETEARVDAVRSALSHMAVNGAPPMVYITDVNPATSPGALASQITRAREAALPKPVLPSDNLGNP